MYTSKHTYTNNNRGSSSRRQSYQQEDKGTTMRKVHSLDCVRLHGLEFKGGWTNPPRSPRRTIQHGKASKFSICAASERVLPPTPESSMLRVHDAPTKNKSQSSLREIDCVSAPSMTRRSMSRPNSVASLTGLDLPQSHEGMTFMESLQGGNVRSSSVFNLIVLSLLLYATISDFSLRTSSKTSYYDELSGEVLYPPYNRSNRSDSSDGQKNNRSNKISKKREKGLLGSAMIQSVTEALSPILPFAGGVDLRRDENWKSWSSWLTLWDERSHNSRMKSPKHVVDQVTTIPRGGKLGGNKNHEKNTGKKGRKFQTKQTLSTPDPFLSTDEISKMTLQEISLIFQYAVSSGNEKMDAKIFLKQKFPADIDVQRMNKAIKAVEDAITRSRGEGVIHAITSHHDGKSNVESLSEVNGYGDVDALKFCAAMRILAEWRVLRQVPPGFKGYAVGMNLGHKDVVQNIVKIENAIHEWIDNKAEEKLQKREDEECAKGKCNSNLQPRSPTLRELLQFEIDNDVHRTTKLPQLKDKTAAMGLLWVRRQLQYQTTIFNNIISVPEVFPTIIDAVGAAYSEVYGHLHGWTVQKIFNYSFQSAPDADLIFRHMNPRKLKEVERNGKISNIDSVLEDIPTFDSGATLNPKETISVNEINNIKEKNKRDDSENPFEKFFSNVGAEYEKILTHVGSEVEKIGNHIGGEWDKTVCNIANIFNQNHKNNCNMQEEINTRGGASSSTSTHTKKSSQMTGDKLDVYISQEMAADARKHILMYLDTAVPLLNDLSGLFDEMNMDDPTKV